MHSSLVRIQNVFGFLTTIVTVVGCLIAATDLFHARTPTAKVTPAGLQVVRGRANYYSTKKEEAAVVRFNLNADLSSLFTWNTKEVFVYVTAEWADANETDAGDGNVAVIWDSIITSPSSDYLANLSPIAKRRLLKSGEGKSIDPSRGLIKLKNQKPKYHITHPSGKIAETDGVRLRVHYNVQPWIGLLSWNLGSKGQWLLPERGGAGSPLWKPMANGESKPFSLPAVAGSKKKDAPAKSKA